MAALYCILDQAQNCGRTRTKAHVNQIWKRSMQAFSSYHQESTKLFIVTLEAVAATLNLYAAKNKTMDIRMFTQWICVLSFVVIHQGVFKLLSNQKCEAHFSSRGGQLNGRTRAPMTLYWWNDGETSTFTSKYIFYLIKQRVVLLGKCLFKITLKYHNITKLIWIDVSMYM